MFPTSAYIFGELKIYVGVWFGSILVPWKLKELRQSLYVLTLETVRSPGEGSGTISQIYCTACYIYSQLYTNCYHNENKWQKGRRKKDLLWVDLDISDFLALMKSFSGLWKSWMKQSWHSLSAFETVWRWIKLWKTGKEQTWDLYLKKRQKRMLWNDSSFCGNILDKKIVQSFYRGPKRPPDE